MIQDELIVTTCIALCKDIIQQLLLSGSYTVVISCSEWIRTIADPMVIYNIYIVCI